MADYGGITDWLRSNDIFQLLRDKFDTVFEIRSKYRKMLLEHRVKSIPLFAIIVSRTTVGPKFHSSIIFVKKLISTHIQRPRYFHRDLWNIRRLFCESRFVDLRTIIFRIEMRKVVRFCVEWAVARVRLRAK